MIIKVMGVEKLVHECLWIVVQYFLFGHGCLIMGVLYILILDITAGVQKTQTHTHTRMVHSHRITNRQDIGIGDLRRYGKLANAVDEKVQT